MHKNSDGSTQAPVCVLTQIKFNCYCRRSTQNHMPTGKRRKASITRPKPEGTDLSTRGSNSSTCFQIVLHKNLNNFDRFGLSQMRQVPPGEDF